MGLGCIWVLSEVSPDVLGSQEVKRGEGGALLHRWSWFLIENGHQRIHATQRTADEQCSQRNRHAHLQVISEADGRIGLRAFDDNDVCDRSCDGQVS